VTSPLAGVPHAHIRLWFRGQGNALWKLEPGVYRPGFAPDDDKRILKERHLVQDFESFSAQLRSGTESDAEMYFLQQHYRMPTRLLDWTTNPLAALYFALEPAAVDGKLFLLDSYQFVPFEGQKTVRHVDFKRAMRALFEREDDAWPEHIMAVRPPSRDKRIIAQSGFFTFHPPKVPVLTDASNRTLQSFVIPSAEKPKLRRELDLLGVHEFQIYGDLDHLADWLKRAYA
jgi:FRG domain